MGDIHSFGYVDPTAHVFDPHLSIFLNERAIRVGAHSRIDGLVKIEGGRGVTIGSHVHISSFVHLNIGGGVLRIGDYVAVTSGAAILSGTNTMAGRAMSSVAPKEMQVVHRTETVLESFAFVGSHAIVYPGVRLGRYAVVKAGSVVTKDVPDYAIVAGTPARIVGDRRDQAGWHFGYEQRRYAKDYLDFTDELLHPEPERVYPLMQE